MLAATGTKSVGESPKIFLIDSIEDRNHGLLNNLVLQRRNSQRPFPSVVLRYPDSLHGQRPERSAVNPAVQIDESFFQPGLVLLPCHSVHSRRGLPLECVKAVLEQCRCYMAK